MAVRKQKARSAPDFDVAAFESAWQKWVDEENGVEKLNAGMDAVRAEARRLRRGLEVRPEVLNEAVTF